MISEDFSSRAIKDPTITVPPDPCGPPPLALPASHLDLPCKLDVIRDVKVDLEVNQVGNTLVNKGVEALNDQDLPGMMNAGGISAWRGKGVRAAS